MREDNDNDYYNEYNNKNDKDNDIDNNNDKNNEIDNGNFETHDNYINNDIDNITKSKLVYKYFTEILNFENKIEILYTNYNWVESNNAFIIQLKDYQAFKDSIFYDILKQNNNNENSCTNKINEFIKDHKISNIEKIDKIFIKSKRELKDLLRENNEYKLISIELGNIICNETPNNKRFYIYVIDYPDLMLYIDFDETISLSCNNNIINKESYSG